MDVEKLGIRSIFAPLEHSSADAPRVARAAGATLTSINAALAPIVSERGVGALYRRSLYLIRTDYPWLLAVYEGALVPGEFGPLEAALSRQSGRDALEATDALLQAFHGLLTSLIGVSLSERLLQSVWHTPSSGEAVQDTSP